MNHQELDDTKWVSPSVRSPGGLLCDTNDNTVRMYYQHHTARSLIHTLSLSPLRILSLAAPLGYYSPPKLIGNPLCLPLSLSPPLFLR